MTQSTLGITEVDCDRFATCGLGNKVFLWKIKESTIIQEDTSYEVEHDAHGIHYDGTYYCVLHQADNAVTILDDGGRHVRKFVIKKAFGREVEFCSDIHSDGDTHNVYIPCWDYYGVSVGILYVSVEGEVLRFNTLERDGCPSRITGVHGMLCVLNSEKTCVIVISNERRIRCKLLDDSVFQGDPGCVAVNKSMKYLIISYENWNDCKDVVTVFSLKYKNQK